MMRKSIPVHIRRAVWEQAFSTLYGNCPCCQDKINAFTFEVGHIHAHTNGGSINLDNLKPICNKCNKSMGSMNMTEFIAKYGIKADMEVVDEIEYKMHKVHLNTGESTNMVKAYLAFDSIFEPASKLSKDLIGIYELYLYNCDNLIESPENYKSLNLLCPIERWKSHQDWRMMDGFYIKGKFLVLYNKIKKILE